MRDAAQLSASPLTLPFPPSTGEREKLRHSLPHGFMDRDTLLIGIDDAISFRIRLRLCQIILPHALVIFARALLDAVLHLARLKLLGERQRDLLLLQVLGQ